MDATGKEGLKPWTPLFFSLVLILGMLLGFNLRDTLRNKRDIATVVERNDRLEQIIDLVNEKYVDSVNSDGLYNDAITGILKSLDPHTVYIPTDQTQEANEDLEGEFSGIGVEYAIIKDTVAITAVIEKGPASKAGLLAGDQIIRVNDTLVAGNNVTQTRITRLLKGRQKSKVVVAVKRYKDQNPHRVTIVRDLIPIPSIDAAIMIDPATAYIKINKFSASVHKEFVEALKPLLASGATQLIIDLRDNPGGYLDQVTEIADELLDDNKLIMYTAGLHSSKTSYKAEKEGLFEHGKLAVLINESSASASEILAGAIQDWDRGVIVGRRSFGKGLVQEPYEMNDGAEIRLTIAKYYTPSGRCIQRSFSEGREAYANDYAFRLSEDGRGATEVYHPADTTRFFTAAGRVVFGGGGINPDVTAQEDTEKVSPYIENKIYSDELRASIWKYYLLNREKLSFADVQAFNAEFHDENEIMYQYLMSFEKSERKVFLNVLSRGTNLYRFNAYIKSQVARLLFRNNGYYSVLLQDDLVLKRAKDVLSDAEYLKIIGRK